MKPIEELRCTPHLCVTGKFGETGSTYHGWVEWPGFRGTVVFGYDEAGWEHVSVSNYNKRKLPSWTDMCRLKEMFWGKDVTVCQFHPAEKAYLHSVGNLENVLHLWRPVDGDFSKITEEMMMGL